MSDLPTWIRHVVGPLSAAGTQICERCGELITDYRDANVLEGDPRPLRGFAPGFVFRRGAETAVITAEFTEFVDCQANPEYDFFVDRPDEEDEDEDDYD